MLPKLAEAQGHENLKTEFKRRVVVLVSPDGVEPSAL
jgi:hypothetical protein